MEPKHNKGKLFFKDYFHVIILAIKLFSFTKNYEQNYLKDFTGNSTFSTEKSYLMI